jgi:ribosome-binding factor A
MPTKRQSQVSEMIRRNFSMVLMEEGKYIYGHEALVTVTNVMVTPDLSEAKIYLSVYNIEDKFNVILGLESEPVRLRSSLAQKIRKQVRIIPKLQYFLDDTLDEIYKVNELFAKLERDGQMGKNEE